MPLKPKVCLLRPYFFVHLPPNFTLHWDATEALQEAMLEKFSSKYSTHSYLGSSLRSLAGNFSTHHPSPLSKLCIPIKWFSCRILRWFQRWKVLQETVLHQVRGVYANVVHHVNVFNGFILSLDECRTARPRLDGTLFRGLWAMSVPLA